VNRHHLAPARVELHIGTGGQFSVKNVHLLASGNIAAEGWVSGMPSTLVDDMQFIRTSPIYTNSCPDAGVCPQRHWSCPFVKSVLHGGSVRARQTNRNLYLITPGTTVFDLFARKNTPCFCSNLYFKRLLGK